MMQENAVNALNAPEGNTDSADGNLTEGNTQKKGSPKTGRAKNKMSPDPKAQGDHTVIKGKWGEVDGYETYTTNPKNPRGFDSAKRVDVKGGTHTNKLTGQDISTPHVYGKDIPGGVRPAEPSEIPRRF